MDADGYPEDAELHAIQKWPADDPRGLMDYVRELWSYPEYWNEIPEKKYTRYQISTGGWSGNEDLICAMESNLVFWAMNWHSATRGGHYEFRIPA